MSYGFGSEYKYDWGHYQTKTFSSQTRGHLINLGIFANAGYMFNENQILSFHSRNDDHKETGGNTTYKINFTQFFSKFKLGATHSTGLKNASLYELYGNVGQKKILILRKVKPMRLQLNMIFLKILNLLLRPIEQE